MTILIAFASLIWLFTTYGRVWYDHSLHSVCFALRALPSYPIKITIFWTFFWISAMLISFLLGMLRSVDLGVKVLGYEDAAIVGL